MKKNEIIKTNSEILKECRIFYQKLFTKQENCVETQNEILNKLPTSMENEQNEYLTKLINKNKLKQAIFPMQNDKSPGIDGIPVEFYKTFYKTLENDLIQLYNNILFLEKNITNTMKQAIITLIPKKGDSNKLKYWRSISLLCIDYKILTKILANRLKHVLPNIISKEQTCSIPNRTILNNVFQIGDIITLTKEKKY